MEDPSRLAPFPAMANQTLLEGPQAGQEGK